MIRPVIAEHRWAACVVFIAAAVAHASPVLSGDIVAVDPPSSVRNDVQTGNVMWLFGEQAHLTLAAPIDVDIRTPTTVVSPLRGTTPGTVDPGTVVDVYFLHHKPDVTSTHTASIVFNCDILGVIISDDLLDASDGLGYPETSYPTGLFGRGTAEAGSSGDRVELSGDRRMLTVVSLAGGIVDQVRVLVAATDNCPPAVPGDCDHDTDVDADDFAEFATCASGPEIPLPMGCQCEDLDGDGDGDQFDFAIFQRSYSGGDTPSVTHSAG